MLMLLPLAMAAQMPVAEAPATADSAPPAMAAVRFDGKTTLGGIAEGLADRKTGRKVTIDDPVRVASISKLVTAIGVMRMVDQGKLNLDRDVSDYLGWTLRNPAFPDRPITLRLLLGHRSSLVDGPDLYIIPLGETLRERMADPRVWDTKHAPGSDWFHYTNLNFPVVASVMETVSGERFDRLMQRLVLKPLKLDACFNWSGCSPASAARAVVLYRATGEVAKDDLGGKLPDCLVVPAADGSCDLSRYQPGENGSLFSPQGGLRISMRGLARIGQVMANGGKGLLSKASHASMTRSFWRFDGTNGLDEDGTASGFFCTYSLAVQTIEIPFRGCRDGLFGDSKVRMGHSGDAYSLKSGLWWDPDTGKGLAYFTSAVSPDDKGRRSAFTAREEALIDRLRR
ncbi:MAG: serine hydrolase domain-containing protein [Novosphingobium sp.]